MRSIRYAIIIALIIISLSHAQDSSQWHLPDGAKMRLGKGRLYDFDYSPDGTKIALATGIGIWIYDAQTGEALDLSNVPCQNPVPLGRGCRHGSCLHF